MPVPKRNQFVLAFERIHLTPADWAEVLVQFPDCPVPERGLAGISGGVAKG
jgi:hypothetical protein